MFELQKDRLGSGLSQLATFDFDIGNTEVMQLELGWSCSDGFPLWTHNLTYVGAVLSSGCF